MFLVFTHTQTPIGLQPWGVTYYELRRLAPHGHKKHWDVHSLPEPVKVALARKAGFEQSGLVTHNSASRDFMVALWRGDAARLAYMRLCSHGTHSEIICVRVIEDRHIDNIRNVGERFEHHGHGGNPAGGTDLYTTFMKVIDGFLGDIQLTRPGGGLD